MTTGNSNENLVCVNGIWKARWWDHGKERRRTLGTRNVKEARVLVKKIMAEIEARRQGVEIVEPAVRPETMWTDLVTDYLNSPGWRKLAPNTKKRYLLDIKRIAQFLTEADIRPAEADLSTVSAFVNDLNDDGLTNSSIRNALTAWARVMHVGVMSRKILQNPIAQYERRDLAGGARMQPPLNGEFEHILPELRAWDADMALFAEFLYRTGCRATEALLLEAEDRLPDGRLYLHRGVKRGRARSIEPNSAVDLLPLLPRTGRLFDALDRRIAVVSSNWGEFWRKRIAREESRVSAQRAVMPQNTPKGRMPGPDSWQMRRWRLHDHRHAFAIQAILAGAHIGDLARHLGHQSVRTTEVYLRAMEQLPVALRPGLRLDRVTDQSDVRVLVEEVEMFLHGLRRLPTGA